MVVDSGNEATSWPDDSSGVAARYFVDKGDASKVRVLAANGGLTQPTVVGKIFVSFARSAASPYARVFPIPGMLVPGSVAPLLGVAGALDAIGGTACAIFTRRGVTFQDGNGVEIGAGPRVGNLFKMRVFPVRNVRRRVRTMMAQQRRAAVAGVVPVKVDTSGGLVKKVVAAAAETNSMADIEYECLRSAKRGGVGDCGSDVDKVWELSALAAVQAEVMRLHRAHAHPALQLMQMQARRGDYVGLVSRAAKRYLLTLSALPCVHCIRAKMQKTLVPKVAAPTVLGANERDGAKVVYDDIAGPFVRSRTRRYRYFVVFVHRRTGYSWVGFMRKKSELFDVIRKQKRMWEAHLKEELVFFMSDNAKEYTSEALRDWFIAEKVNQRFSCPNSSAQNGMAERKIRTLRERAHALMAHSGAAGDMWAEAVRHANDVSNHTPSWRGGERSGLSAHQRLVGAVGRDVFLSRCAPFGSLTLSHLPQELRPKFGDKARECVFLGVSNEHKDGLRLMHLATGRVIISRSFRSFPDVFPFSSSFFKQPRYREEPADARDIALANSEIESLLDLGGPPKAAVPSGNVHVAALDDHDDASEAAVEEEPVLVLLFLLVSCRARPKGE